MSAEDEYFKLQIVIKQLDNEINIDDRIVHIVDEIDIYTPKHISDRLRAIIMISGDSESPITLDISSYGGDVYGAIGSVDIIQSAPVLINTRGVGAVMSAAAFILAAGTGNRSLTKNSVLMLHQMSSWLGGKTEDIATESAHVKVLQVKLESFLAEFSNEPADYWKLKTTTNLYLTAPECLKLGLIDSID